MQSNKRCIMYWNQFLFMIPKGYKKVFENQPNTKELVYIFFSLEYYQWGKLEFSQIPNWWNSLEGRISGGRFTGTAGKICLCKLQNCPRDHDEVYCIFYPLQCRSTYMTWAIHICLMPWLMFRKKSQWTPMDRHWLSLHAEYRIFKEVMMGIPCSKHIYLELLSFWRGGHCVYSSWVMCLTNCLLPVIIPLWSSSVCLVLTRAANLNILVVRNWFLIQFRRVGRYSKVLTRYKGGNRQICRQDFWKCY